MEDSVVGWIFMTLLTYGGIVSIVKKGLCEKKEREAENWYGR